MLYIAALSLLLVAFGHSYYGERLLLRPLFKSDALSMFKREQAFAEKVLRAGWHVLTATWVVMAIVLLSMQGQDTYAAQIYILATIILFGALGVGALMASRGRHLSWIFFFTTAGFSLAHFPTL